MFSMLIVGANFRNALKDAGLNWLNAYLVENSIVIRGLPMET
jgi:hypothetical protein